MPLLTEAERHLRMGRLLLDNGFGGDALPPLQTACETLLQAAVTVALGEPAAQKPVTADVIETVLVPQGLLPTEAPAALARIRATGLAAPDAAGLPDLYAAADAMLRTLRATPADSP